MADYVVTWSINIEDVGGPEAAAGEALAIQRDRTSGATVFTVQEVLTTADGYTLGPAQEVDL